MGIKKKFYHSDPVSFNFNVGKDYKVEPGNFGYITDSEGNVIGHQYVPLIKEGTIAVGTVSKQDPYASAFNKMRKTKWPKKK